MRRTTVAAPLERHRKAAEVGQRDRFAKLPVEFAQRLDFILQYLKKQLLHLVKYRGGFVQAAADLLRFCSFFRAPGFPEIISAPAGFESASYELHMEFTLCQRQAWFLGRQRRAIEKSGAVPLGIMPTTARLPCLPATSTKAAVYT